MWYGELCNRAGYIGKTLMHVYVHKCVWRHVLEVITSVNGLAGLENVVCAMQSHTCTYDQQLCVQQHMWHKRPHLHMATCKP